MPRPLRAALICLASIALFATTLAGAMGGGFAITMGRSFHVIRPVDLPPTVRHEHMTSDGRIPVAVLLGRTGSVATDVLGPYEVFASSPRFDVFTVSVEREPVALSGGLTAIPDYSVQDVLDGRSPEPGIIVMPAVVDPTGPGDAPLRHLIERVHANGHTIMSVCAGARVLAATAVLSGRRATSFWSDLPDLRSSHPETTWESGVRWVEDGNVLTTAGVSSGIAGALHLVERYAGADEAAHIAASLGYPSWEPGPAPRMPEHTIAVDDYPYVLAATFPAFQPTYGIGLTPGVGEIAVAAAAELYGGASFLAHTIPVATADTIVTKHGLTLAAMPIHEADVDLDRLVVPGVMTSPLRAGHAPVYLPERARDAGESSFDPVFEDIARQAGVHAARSTAKYIEYPAPDGTGGGGQFPARILILAIGSVGLATLVGALPALVARRRRVQRHRAPGGPRSSSRTPTDATAHRSS